MTFDRRAHRPAVAGLLLAAGGGRRMGMPKALLPFQGPLLVEHGTTLLHEGGCDPIVVVLGAGAEQICSQSALNGAELRINKEWAQGMGSSLCEGLRALDGRADAVVIALVDQPLVGSSAIHRLVEAWMTSDREATVATYGGQPRNPVLLEASLWPEVKAAAKGELGARQWLRANPKRVGWSRVMAPGTHMTLTHRTTSHLLPVVDPLARHHETFPQPTVWSAAMMRKPALTPSRLRVRPACP